MPFDRNFPRTFSAPSIRQYAPAYSGVYGLSNARGWVYIGESDNIQESLLAHLSAAGDATGFVFEICDPALRAKRWDRLIHEYEPVRNRR